MVGGIRRHCWRAVIALVVSVLSLAVLAIPPANATSTAPSSDSASQSEPHATTPSADTLVFIGLGALRWRDINPATTPYLWTALHGTQPGAGSLVVRTVRPLTCPADGWLTVGAGQRVSTGEDTPCHPLASFRHELPWHELLQINERTHYGAQLGLLAETLKAHQLSAAAIGPGATLALTDKNGMPHPVSYPAVVASTTIGNQTAALVAKGEADLLLIDAAAGADDVTGLTTGALPQSSPADQVIAKRVDARLGAALRGIQHGLAARADQSQVRIIFASMHDRYNRPFLHFYGEVTIAENTPVFADELADTTGDDRAVTQIRQGGPSWVSDPQVHQAGSASTRQRSLSQTTDLLPTLLDRLDVQVPHEAIGTPIALDRSEVALRAMQSEESDVDRHIDRSRAALPLLYPLYVLTVLALMVVAAQLLRHPRISEVDAGTHGGLAWWAAIPIAVPLGVYLVDMLPWWRLDGPMIGADAAPIIGALGGLACGGLLAAIALAIRRIPAVALLAAALWVTLVVDALTGSHVQRTAIMGSFATVGGRFYGINNTAFTLLLVSSLIFAAALAAKLPGRWPLVAVAVIGLITIVVDGAPMWGADFGGPPALLPAFLVLGLLVAGMRITWRRLLAIAVFTAGVVAAIAVLDWLRPETARTHLGHMVSAALSGDLDNIIARKLSAIVSMALSWQALAMMAAIVLLLSLALRGILAANSAESNEHAEEPGLRAAWRRTWQTLRADYRSAAMPPLGNAAAVAITIGLVLGFFLNDSGPVILALGAAVAISCYLSYTHERLRRLLAPGVADQTPPAPEAASAGERDTSNSSHPREHAGEPPAALPADNAAKAAVSADETELSSIAAKGSQPRPKRLQQAGKIARGLPLGLGIRNLVQLTAKRPGRKGGKADREQRD